MEDKVKYNQEVVRSVEQILPKKTKTSYTMNTKVPRKISKK
jgi:hypothetical protein